MSTKTAPTLLRIAPIVPVSGPTAFKDPAWLFEPKYDGFRGMVYLTRQSCSIYSKRGNRFSRFEDLPPADHRRASGPSSQGRVPAPFWPFIGGLVEAAGR
jgi:ATP-dependent DNA ligase